MLIGKDHYKLNNKEPQLIMAGRLKIVCGNVVEINNDSVHYTPNKKDFLSFVDKINNKSVFVNLKINYIIW